MTWYSSYIWDSSIINKVHINIANLPNFFLHKLGSYRSQLFGGTLHHLDSLCSFDLPPTSKDNTCKKRERLACTSIESCFLENTIFWGVIHESTRSIHCSLLITFTGEVFLTRCRGTESKKSFFSLYRCWRTADCIISKQPFLTTSLLVSMSNFAYPYVQTCIRNFATNTRNEQLAIRNYSN